MSKPITPDEVSAVKESITPAEVFDAFNECISRRWNGRSANVVQGEVIALIKKKLPLATFEFDWLNVEDVYRAAGWNVEYDKPGYNESYGAFFVFTKRSKP